MNEPEREKFFDECWEMSTALLEEAWERLQFDSCITEYGAIGSTDINKRGWAMMHAGSILYAMSFYGAEHRDFIQRTGGDFGNVAIDALIDYCEKHPPEPRQPKPDLPF